MKQYIVEEEDIPETQKEYPEAIVISRKQFEDEILLMIVLLIIVVFAIGFLFF